MYNTQTPADKAKDKNNTYGPTFTNEDAMKRMAVNYWNKNMTIEINDGNKDKDGIFKATSNTGVKLIITSTTASALLAAGEEIYDLIKEGKEFTSIGVPCGIQTSNLIEFSNGKNIGLPEGLYLVIYKDIQDDRIAKGFTAYPFTNKVFVRDYNYKNGQAKTEATKILEFKDFLTILKEYSKSMSMAMAHAVKEGSKYEKMSNIKTLSVIAAKLGIDLTSDFDNKRKAPRNSLFENYSGGGSDDKSLSLNEDDFSSAEFDVEYMN